MMSKESGYVSLYRSLAHSGLWMAEPFTRGQAWADLILLANYRDGFIRVRGNRIDVARGQVGYSALKLADRWQWSRGKVNRFLSELENDERIVQQKNKLSTLISIANYDEYQSSGTTDSTTNDTTGDTTDVQQTGQQTDTNNKNNNINNKNNTPLTPQGDASPSRRKSKTTLSQYIENCRTKNAKPIRPEDPIFGWVENIKLPDGYIQLAWLVFKNQFTVDNPEQTQKDWPAHFRNYAKKGYLKLWYIDKATEAFSLTTVGMQAAREHGINA